jgi:diguanylate cyclase (GGDEF)-like protein/PAS domain S-box-containing protein
MISLARVSIRWKITALVMSASGVALLLACAAFLVYDRAAQRETMQQELNVLAQVVADRSTASLAFEDPITAEESLGALRARRSIVSAYIYDKDGKLFARYARTDADAGAVPPAPLGAEARFEGGRLMVSQRILVRGHVMGTLVVVSDLDDLNARLRRYTGIVGLVLLFCTLAAFLVSHRLQRVVSGPVLSLAQTAARVTRENDYALRAVKQNDDEVGLLIDTFNEMLRQVQERDDALLLAKEEAEKAAARAGESEHRFRQLAETIEVVFWMVDAETRALIYVSPAYERIWGQTCESLFRDPESFYRVMHEQDRARIEEAFRGPKFEALDEEYRIVPEDGGVRWVRTRSFPIRREDGTVYRIVGLSQDITDRKKAEADIRHRAYHDELTGLPNRLLFSDRFAQTLDHVRRTGQTVALLFLDLDRFKTINDTLGHAAGDRLLQAVAERLRGSLRGGDTVARFGGDEFIVLVAGVEEGQDAAQVAEKILQIMRPPFLLGAHELRITTSIGICIYPDDGDDIETLVKNADAALYRAKERGRNCYHLYSPALNALALEQLALENDLRRALERMEFLLHYQPEMELRTGRIVGAEALVRWQRPGREILLPQAFIPLAEDTGLIDPLGEWVLRAACEQGRRWKAAGIDSLRVAVNLSPRQFEQKDLARVIERALAQADLDPTWLELELTEGAVMKNAEAAADTLRDLKAMGVHIVIDDFGTGYSSLSYLKRFPVSALKIDQSFVRDVVNDPEDATIVKAVISMAHSLGLKVIAEGVETSAQLDFLRELQCDVVQGYLLGRPMSAEALEERVRAASVGAPSSKHDPRGRTPEA